MKNDGRPPDTVKELLKKSPSKKTQKRVDKLKEHLSIPTQLEEKVPELSAMILKVILIGPLRLLLFDNPKSSPATHGRRTPAGLILSFNFSLWLSVAISPSSHCWLRPYRQEIPFEHFMTCLSNDSDSISSQMNPTVLKSLKTSEIIYVSN